MSTKAINIVLNVEDEASISEILDGFVEHYEEKLLPLARVVSMIEEINSKMEEPTIAIGGTLHNKAQAQVLANKRKYEAIMQYRASLEAARIISNQQTS